MVNNPVYGINTVWAQDQAKVWWLIDFDGRWYKFEDVNSDILYLLEHEVETYFLKQLP